MGKHEVFNLHSEILETRDKVMSLHNVAIQPHRLVIPNVLRYRRREQLEGLARLEFLKISTHLASHDHVP